MTRRRLPIVLLIALSFVLAVLPASAETTAEKLQRLLWTYGDTGVGWTGADGTYSVPLPDGRIAWLFSDTFLGAGRPVSEDRSRQGHVFVHNSMVVQDGNEMTTVLPIGDRTLIEPLGGAGFYWVGDGIVENENDGIAGNEKLLVFVMHFVAAPAPYAFQQIGTAVAEFSLPPKPLLPTLENIVPLPHAFFSRRRLRARVVRCSDHARR